jgi:uncharacterized protein
MGTIATEARLREIVGSPSPLIAAKVTDRLNGLTRQFVERSPFVCVATCRPDGGLDILIPERPGNRLADTLTNLLADRRIALFFLIPGVGDTFRVNGRATIVDDPELLAASAVEGRTPKLGVLVSIEEAFTHCPKALIRSDLWNPERHADASELPTSGAILRAVADADLDAETYDRQRDARYARREGLY